ncbi:MAG: hypothetical protein EA384_09105 [Spirochaetaceae bacterium]|nr:MAG: hypothetical protein EA384_09105 [Spirochaetaceae bacterium]
MKQYVKRSGSGPIDVTVDPGKSWLLHEIRLHLSANGGAGTYTAKIKSSVSEAYDVVLQSQDMTSVADNIFRPAQPARIASTDGIRMEYANASSRVWGLEVVLS